MSKKVNEPDDGTKLALELFRDVPFEHQPDLITTAVAINTLIEQRERKARIEENTISRNRFKTGWETEWFSERISQLQAQQDKEQA